MNKGTTERDRETKIKAEIQKSISINPLLFAVRANKLTTGKEETATEMRILKNQLWLIVRKKRGLKKG